MILPPESLKLLLEIISEICCSRIKIDWVLKFAVDHGQLGFPWRILNQTGGKSFRDDLNVIYFIWCKLLREKKMTCARNFFHLSHPDSFPSSFASGSDSVSLAFRTLKWILSHFLGGSWESRNLISNAAKEASGMETCKLQILGGLGAFPA